MFNSQNGVYVRIIILLSEFVKLFLEFFKKNFLELEL